MPTLRTVLILGSVIHKWEGTAYVCSKNNNLHFCELQNESLCIYIYLCIPLGCILQPNILITFKSMPFFSLWREMSSRLIYAYSAQRPQHISLQVCLKVEVEDCLFQNHQGYVIKCKFTGPEQSIGSGIQISKICSLLDPYPLQSEESLAQKVHENRLFFSPGCLWQ